jgi:hypothetical protein
MTPKNTTRTGPALKKASGWFAAGDSFRCALTALSDGAFKLFAYICLEADRRTGRLLITQTELAQALGKSRRIIGAYVAELQAQGVCCVRAGRNQFARTVFEVSDAYWPYERSHQIETEPSLSAHQGGELGGYPNMDPREIVDPEASQEAIFSTASAQAAARSRNGHTPHKRATDSAAANRNDSDQPEILAPVNPRIRADESRYIEAVRRTFLSLGCTRGVFRTTDDATASRLHARGIPLSAVHDALVLGALRKYRSWLEGGAGEAIATLRYFEPIVEEVVNKPLPPGYDQYLRDKLQKFRAEWLKGPPLASLQQQSPNGVGYISSIRFGCAKK